MAKAIEFPQDLEPNTAAWEYDPNTFEFESKFTGHSQVMEGQGARWKVAFNYKNLTQEKLRSIRFIETMPRGTVFKVPAYGFQYRGVDKKSTPLVSTSGQSGTVIKTSGWALNAAVLERGDVVAIDGELKVIAERIITSKTGEANLIFTSPVRNKPKNGAKVTYRPAIVNMRRVVKKSASISQTHGSSISGVLSAVSIGLEEAIQ